jgi:hypothetical protein
MIKNVYEILDEFEKQTTREGRKEILLKNGSPYFKQFLKFAFDPTIQFYISEFPDNYKQPDTFPGLRIAGLESELRKTYLFTIGDPTADLLSESKRKLLLLQMLESFEPREADMYVRMLNKDLKIPYLTEKLLKEVFPSLINEAI